MIYLYVTLFSSLAPSSNPSSKPSLIPTLIPTLMPSSLPSSMPSFIPTSMPSSQPRSTPFSNLDSIPTSHHTADCCFLLTSRIKTMEQKVLKVIAGVAALLLSHLPKYVQHWSALLLFTCIWCKCELYGYTI